MSRSRCVLAVSPFVLVVCGSLALPSLGAPLDAETREGKVEPPTITVAARLATKVTVDLAGKPLDEALDGIGTATGVAIVLDGDGLKQSGFTRSMRQTLTLRETPAAKVLDAIVAQYPGMTYVVDEAGKRVVVTTAANRAMFAPPKPAADRAETFDWSNLVSEAQLDDEIDAIRTRVRQGLATPVMFGKSRLEVARDAGTLVVLAELGLVHEDASFHDLAGRLHAIGTSLRSAARMPRAAGYEAAKSAGGRLEALFMQPRPDADPRGKLDPSPLTATMQRFDRFHATLRTAAEDPTRFAQERADLAREAALVAALAKLVTTRDESREDADFAGHASELSDAALALRKGLDDEQAPAAIRTQLDVVTRVCSQCHADFR